MSQLTNHELEEMVREIWGTNGLDKHRENCIEQQRKNTMLYFAQEAYKAKEMKRKYEEQEKHYLDRLKDLTEYKSASFDNYVLAKETRAGSVNYKSIPELRGVDLEQYRGTPVVVWKLIKTGE